MLKPFARKHIGYLVARRDIPTVREQLPPGTPLISWEDMGRLQAGLIATLDFESETKQLVADYTALHYRQLGMPFEYEFEGDCMRLEKTFDGSEERYVNVRAGHLSASLENYLLGSEVVFCARSGIMPTPPRAWLGEEPCLVDVAGLNQTTAERSEILWQPSGLW